MVVTGAVMGGVSSATKVSLAAKAWDASSKGEPLKYMSQHYSKHVIQEGKNQ